MFRFDTLGPYSARKDKCEPYIKEENKSKPKNTDSDKILNILSNGYICHSRIVWFMHKGKSPYNSSTFSFLSRNYGIEAYVYDPFNDDPLGGRAPVPQNWHEALITDCLEYCENFLARANIIKFGLSCVSKVNSDSKLTILVKKDMGLDENDIKKSAIYVNASKVWTPHDFGSVKDYICVAAK